MKLLLDKIKLFFHKDNLAFGVLLALCLSIGIYAAFSAAAYFFPETFTSHYLRQEVILMISVFINLLPFRTYMVGLKFEKTGRGILVAIFVLMILVFVLIKGNKI